MEKRIPKVGEIYEPARGKYFIRVNKKSTRYAQYTESQYDSLCLNDSKYYFGTGKNFEDRYIFGFCKLLATLYGVESGRNKLLDTLYGGE